MKTLLPALALLLATGCAAYEPQPTMDPTLARAFAKHETERRASPVTTEHVQEMRKAQEYRATRARLSREYQAENAEQVKAEAIAAASTPEASASRTCQAEADLTQAKAEVSAIRAKQARFGVINLRALSEAADEVIRLEGEVKAAKEISKCQ